MRAENIHAIPVLNETRIKRQTKMNGVFKRIKAILTQQVTCMQRQFPLLRISGYRIERSNR